MRAPRTCSVTGLWTSLPARSRLLAKAKFIVATGACLLLLAACGGGGGSATPGFGSGIDTSGSGASSGNNGSSGSGADSGNTGSVTPTYSLGNGSGSGFKDGVIDTSKTTLLAGETATLRVNVVDQNGNPPTVDLVVNFSSNCASDGLATFGTVTQVTRGLFSVGYTNNGCEKPSDVVTAQLIQNNRLATVTVKAVGPDVLSVSFVSATVTQLSLAGIGGNESSELTFLVAGPQGVPVVGKTVDFSINTKVGGATILSGRETGVTDQAGQVRTVINSGTIAGPVNVKAVERGTGRQGISSDIVISTGVADANRFSISYTPQNPAKAYDTDLVPVNITIIASDIFGNNPTDGTRVSFVSPESGNVQSSCLLVDGACTVVWRSAGNRPANMRATVLAYTAGAEHFVDNNGNSVYDSTDGAISDIGEPYADENENGQYDLGEYFFDTNKNGVRDSGNGLWDGPCLNKVDASAVCTGSPTVEIYNSVVIVMPGTNFTPSLRIKDLGNFPAVGSNIDINGGGATLNYSNLVLEDGNTAADSLGGNPLPSGTTVDFLVEGGGVTLQGFTTHTISNAISPEAAGVFGTTMVAASLSGGPAPTGVRLVLRITIPGVDTFDFAWPIIVH